MDLYKKIKNKIPQKVSLIVVSKMQSIKKIKEIYKLGHRDFGENQVQELLKKKSELPDDIRWHFIGHLQSKKVKKIISFINLIQSVDSLKLIKEIQKQAKLLSINIPLLLQIKIAEENSKFGLNQKNYNQIISLYKDNMFPNITIKGIMGIATFTNNHHQIKNEFLILKKYFNELKKEIISTSILSMGMSNDYKIAIFCGSSMLRIGSSIFTNKVIN